MRLCSLVGCGDKFLARDMCNRHYLRWRAAGGETRQRVVWSDEMDRQLVDAGLTAWTERYRSGGRLSKVAEALDVTDLAARNRLSRLKRKSGQVAGTIEGLWTLGEDDVIRSRMWLDGPDWQTTGAAIGRTPGACNTRAVKLRKLERLERERVRKRERLEHLRKVEPAPRT